MALTVTKSGTVEIASNATCNSLIVQGNRSTIYNNCTIVNKLSTQCKGSDRALTERQTYYSWRYNFFASRPWRTVSGIFHWITRAVGLDRTLTEPKTCDNRSNIFCALTDNEVNDNKGDPLPGLADNEVNDYKSEASSGLADNEVNDNKGDPLPAYEDFIKETERKYAEFHQYLVVEFDLRLYLREMIKRKDIEWMTNKFVGGVTTVARNNLYSHFEVPERDFEDIRKRLRTEESVADEVYKVLNHGLRLGAQRKRDYLLRKLFELDENLARSFFEYLVEEMRK